MIVASGEPFLKYKENDFLNAFRNHAFAINVDWFQPLKKRNDRFVAVIYLVPLVCQVKSGSNTTTLMLIGCARSTTMKKHSNFMLP